MTAVGVGLLGWRGFMTHCDISAVGDVDALHYGAEYGTVGRGVAESVVMDKIVYHLMDDSVVDRFLRQVKTRGYAQLKVGMLA